MSGPRIVFCSNNHIYDASLYDSCPYCSKLDAERKEFFTAAPSEDPYAGAFTGTNGSQGKNPFAENPFAENPFVQPDTGSAGEPADIFGPENADDDPFGATVIGTGSVPAVGRPEFGDSFGTPDSDATIIDVSMRPPVSADMLTDADYGSSGADGQEAEVTSGTAGPLGEVPYGEDGPEAGMGVSGQAEYPPQKIFHNDPESEQTAGEADTESSDEEELQGLKIPFFTKDGVPDPRNIDTSMGMAESMSAVSSEKESAGESEEEAGRETEPKSTDDPSAGTAAPDPLELPSSDSNSFSQKEADPSDPSQTAADAYEDFNSQFEEEDEWDSFPLKDEGPVRGWFILQNGLQKDHSIELCKKSMFIYDYDGMCLIFSRQMEDMTLLATIEQYKTISILPAPGVPFEVNGEARRSCGKLGDYMKLLIGSHRMVYVQINDRLLNGER